MMSFGHFVIMHIKHLAALHRPALMLRAIGLVCADYRLDGRAT
jgi:hypothetical protein